MSRHRTLPLRFTEDEIAELDKIVDDQEAASAGIRANRSSVIRAMLKLGKQALLKQLSEARNEGQREAG